MSSLPKRLPLFCHQLKDGGTWTLFLRTLRRRREIFRLENQEHRDLFCFEVSANGGLFRSPPLSPIQLKDMVAALVNSFPIYLDMIQLQKTDEWVQLASPPKNSLLPDCSSFWGDPSPQSNKN